MPLMDSRVKAARDYMTQQWLPRLLDAQPSGTEAWWAPRVERFGTAVAQLNLAPGPRTWEQWLSVGLFGPTLVDDQPHTVCAYGLWHVVAAVTDAISDPDDPPPEPQDANYQLIDQALSDYRAIEYTARAWCQHLVTDPAAQDTPPDLVPWLGEITAVLRRTRPHLTLPN